MAHQTLKVFDAVRTLRAVRQYRDAAVPDDVVGRIVRAAQLTASAANKQPWHFVVVRDREMLRQLGGIARTGPYVAQAPLAIVVATERTRIALSDASRAIQSMLLVAWDDGVGANWVGFGGLDAAKPLLGIPAELDVVAIVPFGYAAGPRPRGRKKRKPLGEVAHLERFGEPFPEE